MYKRQALLTAALLVALSPTTWAATYTVCPLPDICDYQSPDSAVNDSVIADGDIIDITADTYVLGATLQIDNSITILGNGSVFDANGLPAINVFNANTNFLLREVTIRNGQAGETQGGGALRVIDGATVTVVDAIFENNQAAFGGAVHNSGSTVSITSSALLGNRATAGIGGALLTDGGGITNLTRNEIDVNAASIAGGGVAVADNSSVVNFVNSTISNNTALTAVQTVSNLLISGTTNTCTGGPLGQTFTADAPALLAFEFLIRVKGSSGDMTVIPNDIKISGQVRQGGPTGPIIATASAFAPGGVWPGGSTQTLTFTLDQPVALTLNDTYSIESAIAGAYSIFISPGDDYTGGELYDCSGNSAPGADLYFRTFGGIPGEGAGVYLSATGFAGFFNSTVSGNIGDGIAVASGSTLDAEFITIANNSENGLTVMTGSPGGEAFLQASILAGNGGNDCAGNDIISRGFNLVGNDSNCIFTPAPSDLIGFGEFPIDPLLGPLQDNGGFTLTHAIGPESPALDAAGADQTLPCSDAFEDQRGVARPDGPACDIGAFERVTTIGPLQTLIDAAAPGAIIELPNGTYTELITIGDGKTLRGSGPDNVVIDVSSRSGSAITASGDFSLEGIRVTGGSSNDNGGGVFATVVGVDITLSNVVFDNNAALLDGGAIYISNGTLTGTNVIFNNNNAGGNGGAILSGNTATIINSSFTLNHAGGDGGAIAAFGPLTVVNNVFHNNDADNGGAIYNGLSVAIAESAFSLNRANGGDVLSGQGGAVYNNGSLILSNSSIESSLANTGGGLYNGPNGLATISGTTFNDNNASGSGTVGGAIGGAGTIEITNSTLSGNTAIGGGGNGGGIGLIAGNATLNYTTLVFNSASGLGGPFFAEQGALISLSNSLFSDNSGGATNCSTLLSLGYNLFQNAPCTTAISDIVSEPLIGVLAFNGGPTQTHYLDLTSPARDAADPGLSVIEFNSTLSAAQLSFNGDAIEDGGKLVPVSGLFSVGSIFASAPDGGPFDLTRSFSTWFSFQITDPVSWEEVPSEPSGDGFTFAIAANPNTLGEPGGRLGVAISSDPAGLGTVSVEFDTYPNANDVSTNSIGVNVGGIGDGQGVISNVQTAIPGEFDDGNIWTAWIDYRGDSGRLDVFVAADGLRPELPQLSYTLDIAAEVGPTGYYGFTGGTGRAHARHSVLDWELSITNCPSFDQRGTARPQGAGCDIGAVEANTIPLQLDGVVTLDTQSLNQGLDGGVSYPGVVTVPIIDIPIEKLTGDTFNAPESAPLGSFPLGSFPLGSFDLRNSPLGSFPLGSFPIGSFPLGSFPLGSFPLSSIPLLREGGWSAILEDIPELKSAPLQSVTLEQLLRLNPPRDSVSEIALSELSIEGSPFASLSLPGLALGDTTVAELDEWALNADPVAAETVCAQLEAQDSTFTGCSSDDTLLGLEVEGAPVAALSLSSLPLGSFPIGSFPLGSFPIGSFPLGSFPLGSFPLGSFPLGSFPLGSFPLGSFPLGSFPLSFFDMLAAPLGSFPLGSFPLGSFPLGSFEIDGQSFCEFYDTEAAADGDKTCAELEIDPGTHSLADLVEALQIDDPTGNIGSTPLGSFPLGSFPIGSFPIGSFGLDVLGSPPLSLLTLEDFDGCEAIDGTADCSTIDTLSATSTLLDVSAEYGTLAASPLGSFPLGSFDIEDLPMGSFPLGSFEINGAPLGSFPLGSFDLIGSPLGSFPLGSFPLGSFDVIIDDPDGVCDECVTLSDAARAGVINASATLEDLRLSPEFADTTLGEVLGAMTLAILYGPGTLADIEDTGNLTLGQLLIAMMLKSDFPWETIPLTQLDVQEFAADNLVAYTIDIPLTGTESAPISIAVTMADSFLYKKGSASLDIVRPAAVTPSQPIDDPAIVDNGDGTQTLTFDLVLGGFSDNTITFSAVPALALGDYPATAVVALGSDDPVAADATNGTVMVIPDPMTDISNPGDALTTPVNVLSLGFINTSDDNDYYLIAPPSAGDRVTVFMSNPDGDNDLIMYEPLSTVEQKGQEAESLPLDSVPIEDDGVDYQGNLSEEPNALEDANIGDGPVSSVSTNSGNSDESVSAIAANTEPYTLQVSGYNGALSDQPYVLRVKATPQVPQSQCTPRNWTDRATSSVAAAGSWMPDTNAVFLVNGSRLAASEGNDGGAAADEALTAINNLIHGPNITNGVVVDVSTIFGVDYTAWDLNPCDVDEANKIVNAITRYLEEQRLVSPDLTYVTIVGSDEIIPFARKSDETSIANESTFAGEFSDNALYGAMITRHFLSDDTYGDIDPIPWFDRYLNVPELAVGRLLESAEDIQTAAENYLAFAGILDPQTALSAGYDFVADAAGDIDNTFNEYGPELGYSAEPALIDPPGITPETDAWTDQDFFDATGLNTSNPVEQVSFNMHFDYDEALPSIGDALGNYSDNLIHVSDLDGADLRGGIWFTVGCHSGTNVPDISVIGSAPAEDWPQGFSRLGALYLAQNAYGLGDTEAIALTERLLANFARNLSGRMSVGQAHAFAKQQYFADLGLYGEYDFKALQAATLFGLPMYQYGNGAMVEDPLPPALPVSTDPISGLTSASWGLSDTGIDEEETSKGTKFSVNGDVQFVHFRPLQPIVRRDVTSQGGETASGAFLTALVTEDKEVADIAYARPVIDLGENEPEIETDEMVFPTSFTNIANYMAPSDDGGPFEPRDQLNVIVGQFTSLRDGSVSGIERLFRSFEAEIFYRPTPPIQNDMRRPEFDNVQASVVGSSGSNQAAFSVDVTDDGNVLRVAVLYLQSVSGNPLKGNWVLVDLAPGAGGNTWTGGGPVDLSGVSNGQIDYMVQAVDDNGNVSNSTFKGLFYLAEITPPPPGNNDPDAPFVVRLSDPSDPEIELDNDAWHPVDSLQVDVVVKGDVTYEYSVDGSRPLLPLTSAGFLISGDGVHIVHLYGSDGSVTAFVLLIDNTPPEIIIATPAGGEYIVQGQSPPADYVCRDSGSGAASCSGDVAVGSPVPDASTGTQSFSVIAIDNSGLEASLAESYHVVQQLIMAVPAEPVSIDTPLRVTATATDLADIEEHITVDWGDGSTSSSTMPAPDSILQDGDEFIAEHRYAAPGIYSISVTIEYDGGAHVQTTGVEQVVVYDSQGGFVTGGGWFNSPPGAYTPDDAGDADVIGKTQFSFEVRYKNKRSVPDGNSNFRFAAGDLKFDAASYDWLFIDGAHARFRGEGAVKGHPGQYKFQVTALDSDKAGAAVSKDGFRIRIWQEDNGVSTVLYDNGMGASDTMGSAGTTSLGGGSINIQKTGRK